jgi:hypothetical protein
MALKFENQPADLGGRSQHLDVPISERMTAVEHHLERASHLGLDGGHIDGE